MDKKNKMNKQLPIEIRDRIVLMTGDWWLAEDLYFEGVISKYVYVTLEEMHDKRRKIESKLEEAGLDKLQLIYSEQFKKRVTNLKNTNIRLVVRRERMVRYLMEAIEQSKDKQISQKIIDRYFPNKYLKRKRDE